MAQSAWYVLQVWPYCIIAKQCGKLRDLQTQLIQRLGLNKLMPTPELLLLELHAKVEIETTASLKSAIDTGGPEIVLTSLDKAKRFLEIDGADPRDAKMALEALDHVKIALDPSLRKGIRDVITVRVQCRASLHDRDGYVAELTRAYGGEIENGEFAKLMHSHAAIIGVRFHTFKSNAKKQRDWREPRKRRSRGERCEQQDIPDISETPAKLAQAVPPADLHHEAAEELDCSDDATAALEKDLQHSTQKKIFATELRLAAGLWCSDRPHSA